MKLIQTLAVAVLFLMIPGPLRAEGLGGLHVSYIDGDVQFASADGTEWLPVSLNMPLQKGDRLWVPEDARLELQFSAGTVIRLDRESALDIIAVDNVSAQLYLAQGRAYLNFWNVSDGPLELYTPLASARARNRSIFKADVAEDGTTDISVLKGVVDIESRNDAAAVSGGKRITVRDSGYAEIASVGPPDAWEEWNRERDGRIAGERQGESYQYLPGELRPYAGDFDEYGRWMYVEGYDHVWVPGGIYAADWAPYRVGRWVWVGGDYVWISYEPWGWVPYHYGRWVYVTAIGWCWVPPVTGAVYWGPGFVSWSYTSTYVAWVPLAPGDIYYGYGHYGPSSVNITNVTIYNAPKKVVYKNVHVRNAVTVISRETFLSGKGGAVSRKDNPFLRERAGHGRPDWKPRNETRVPVFKDIPQRRLPPQRFRELTVKDVRRQHPAGPQRTQPMLQRGEPGPRVTVPVPAERERKPQVAPKQTEQRPVQQKPFTVKPEEKQRSVREATEEKEKGRVQRKSADQPSTGAPTPSPYHHGTASEGMKQRSQQPSKALTRPEPGVKHQAVRPERPQQPAETQRVRPEKPKSDEQSQGQGERERSQEPEAFGKERRK
jgi:hypothetical protein